MRNNMDKGMMIARLVVADVELIEEDPEFLNEILFGGFIGYNNRTDDEIQEAYDDRFKEK